jgi:hypothetical protein
VWVEEQAAKYEVTCDYYLAEFLWYFLLDFHLEFLRQLE